MGSDAQGFCFWFLALGLRVEGWGKGETLSTLNPIPGVSPGTAITGAPLFEGGGEKVLDSAAFAASVVAAHAAANAVRIPHSSSSSSLLLSSLELRDTKKYEP